MNLKLDYRTIPIEPMPEESKDAYWGLWLAIPGRIQVAAHLMPAEQARVALHEVLHAIWNARGMADRVGEETAVDGLSRGLVSVFADNPEFLVRIHMALANGHPIV